MVCRRRHQRPFRSACKVRGAAHARYLKHLRVGLTYSDILLGCTAITVHSLLPHPTWWSRFLLRCTTTWTPCTGRCTGDPTLMPSLLGPDIGLHMHIHNTTRVPSRTQSWPLTKPSVCLACLHCLPGVVRVCRLRAGSGLQSGTFAGQAGR